MVQKKVGFHLPRLQTSIYHDFIADQEEGKEGSSRSFGREETRSEKSQEPSVCSSPS